MGPLTPPTDLTVAEPGSTTARDVLSRAVGRCLRDLGPVLRRHRASAPGDVALLERALSGVDRAALASVLRRPHASVLVRVLRDTPTGQGGPVLSHLLALLAFELEALGALAAPVALRQSPARIVSLVTRAGVALPDRTPGPRFPAVDGETVLALEDDNPLALVEAHPDKAGNALDLGGHPAAEWVEALRVALGVAREVLPEARAEMALYAQVIVPVGYDPDRHLSASYREAIGTLYLSLHPDPMVMAEALLHETQHGKLNALLELDDVLEGGREPAFRSPVRPDPRPLLGVLLAVHALVPGARLHELLLARGDPRGSARRLGELVDSIREGAAVLRAHARPTLVGQGVLAEIERWDRHFAGR